MSQHYIVPLNAFFHKRCVYWNKLLMDVQLMTISQPRTWTNASFVKDRNKSSLKSSNAHAPPKPLFTGALSEGQKPGFRSAFLPDQPAFLSVHLFLSHFPHHHLLLLLPVFNSDAPSSFSYHRTRDVITFCLGLVSVAFSQTGPCPAAFPTAPHPWACCPLLFWTAGPRVPRVEGPNFHP